MLHRMVEALLGHSAFLFYFIHNCFFISYFSNPYISESFSDEESSEFQWAKMINEKV